MSDIVKFLSGKDDKKGNVTLDRGQVLFGITQIGPNTYRGSIYLDYFDPTANQIYRVNMSGSGGLYASGLKIKDKNNNSGSETTVAEVNGTATIPLPNYIGEKYFYSDEILSLTHKDASGNQLAKNLAAGTSYFHGGGILMINPNTINQEALIRILGSSGTVENTLELATRDLYTTSNDKAQIVARQYDKNNAILREAILLGTNGNTSFPGTVSAAGLTTTGDTSIGGALNVTGNVTSPKFIGDLQGNADTATDATNSLNDGDGKKISTTYLKLAGGTMTGDISFAATTFNTNPTDSKGIVWSGGSDGAKIFYRQTANDAGSLVLQVSDDGEEYIQFRHTKNGVIYLKPNTKEFYPDTTNTGSLGTSSYRWGKVLIGTADSYGSDTKGIYWKNGVPTAMTYSLSANVQTGAAGALSYYSTTTQIDAFPNTVGSGTKLWYLATGVPTASTSTVGGTAQPVYLSNGTITALTADKGSATQGVYLAKGVITPMTYSLNATLNSGTVNRLAYYSGANAVSSGANLYTNGSVLGVNTTSGSATPYGGTATNYAFNVSGNSYFFGTIEGSDTIKVNRNNAGGGLIVANSNAQYARMYVSTVGGAGNGSAVGATGTAILELGNSTATSSTSGAGKNNAQGLIILYGTSTGYGQLYFDNTYFRPDHDIYFTNNGGATSGWANGIRGLVGTNDYWRVGGGATDSNSGYMELATGDDANEPIYVRQYSGVFSTVNTTLTLLDASHNTIIPNALTVGTTTSQGANYKFYVNGTGYIQSAASNSTTRGLTINNGVLDIVNYGYILSIGNLNSSYTHFETTCSQFYFNKQIAVDGNLFPHTNNTRNLGTGSYKWANIYGVNGYFSALTSGTGDFTQTSMRHIDAALNAINTDHQLYIGYGSRTWTDMVRFYTSTGTAGTDTITGRTEWLRINSSGAYALTRFGVNGQSTSYNLYVNGTSYFSGYANVCKIYNSSNYGSSSSVTFNDLALSNGAACGMIYAATNNPTGGASWCHTWSQSWGNGSNANWVSQIALGTEIGAGMWYRCTSGSIVDRGWRRVLDNTYMNVNSGVKLTSAYSWISIAGTSSFTCPDGTAITQPDGANPMVLYSGAASGRDCGILYLSNDNAYIANSSDNGYTFGVFDTDITQDFSAEGNASLCVRSNGAGTFVRSRLGVNGINDGYNLYVNGSGYIGSVLTNSYHDFVVAGNEFNWVSDAGVDSMWFNYVSGTSRNQVATAINAYYFGNGKTAWNTTHIYAGAVHNAIWNDYAECREADTEEPGRVLFEKGDDTLGITNCRMQAFAGVSSDTYGVIQGETDTAKTPLAVAGRVLAYPYQDRNNYKPGDCVCAAPGGTVDIMTREEIINYPDRIVGIVSCVPTYEEWGTGKVKVNGRIWIKVK